MLTDPNALAAKAAEHAYSAGNLVTCDGYYEFDLDAAQAAIAAVYAPRISELEAEIERLREALGEICRDSNPDWTEKRVYPTDVLDDIHKIAVEAYYFRAALKEPSHDA